MPWDILVGTLRLVDLGLDSLALRVQVLGPLGEGLEGGASMAIVGDWTNDVLDMAMGSPERVDAGFSGLEKVLWGKLVEAAHEVGDAVHLGDFLLLIGNGVRLALTLDSIEFSLDECDLLIFGGLEASEAVGIALARFALLIEAAHQLSLQRVNSLAEGI